MMHRSSGGRTVITIMNNMLVEGLVFRKKYRHIYLYETFEIDKIKTLIGLDNCIEYLDCFLVILPEDYALQSLLWADFYAYCGDRYEKMIDVQNNLNCIMNLYAYIQKNVNIKAATVILDYGCGSGLSININASCRLIGYEPNEKMRRQAVKKGMEVLDRKGINMLPDECVAAVFSSYVFHMGIKESDIKTLSRIIRREGVIVANFYKGINCIWVNNAFAEKGFDVKKIIGLDERFGCIYEYRKK